jgi:hypothetical protein
LCNCCHDRMFCLIYQIMLQRYNFSLRYAAIFPNFFHFFSSTSIKTLKTPLYIGISDDGRENFSSIIFHIELG